MDYCYQRWEISHVHCAYNEIHTNPEFCPSVQPRGHAAGPAQINIVKEISSIHAQEEDLRRPSQSVKSHSQSRSIKFKKSHQFDMINKFEYLVTQLQNKKDERESIQRREEKTVSRESKMIPDCSLTVVEGRDAWSEIADDLPTSGSSCAWTRFSSYTITTHLRSTSCSVICPWWEIGGSAVNCVQFERRVNLLLYLGRCPCREQEDIRGSAVNYYDNWQATLPPSIHSKSPTQVEAYGLPGRLRRSLHAQRTGCKTAIPMRMIVTQLMFIRCPTFTPVGETLALSPTLANFALVLPILPENILVLASATSQKTVHFPQLSYHSREVVDDVPNASMQGPFYMTYLTQILCKAPGLSQRTLSLRL
ncbi:hypothetical protein BT96DRAFT_949177 [Gymnopus androsaceus JB14]|uniref:Uncharacterized protein n=1 Tax=Gymnopus androsaceus JB14 TaxID=1447944 RepID=A0A6A4GLC2_9AGAR|nr:hypothetical protein BT96DRAFT_949177 [Gymnopus androsaceus JB14]